MTMMNQQINTKLKPDDKNQYLKSATTCVNFLLEHFTHERGIFRQATVMTEVRKLKLQLYQDYHHKIREEPDPHIIASCLQNVLKDMPVSVFHDVYDDILHTDITEDIMSGNKAIEKWITKMDLQHFEFVRSMFSFLSRISKQVSELNSSQLSQILSPYLCRRANSAFMSIRHGEDLRRIKPVFSFMIDQFDDIFRELRSSQFTNSMALSSSSALAIKVFLPSPQPAGGGGGGWNQGNWNPVTVTKMQIDSTSVSLSPPKVTEVTCNEPWSDPEGGLSQASFYGDKAATIINSGFSRPSMPQLTAGRLLPTLSLVSPVPDKPEDDSEFDRAHLKHPRQSGPENLAIENADWARSSIDSSPDIFGLRFGLFGPVCADTPNINSWEWKVLRALVHSKLNAFIRIDGSNTGPTQRSFLSLAFVEKSEVPVHGAHERTGLVGRLSLSNTAHNGNSTDSVLAQN